MAALCCLQAMHVGQIAERGCLLKGKEIASLQTGLEGRLWQAAARKEQIAERCRHAQKLVVFAKQESSLLLARCRELARAVRQKLIPYGGSRGAWAVV